jgi:hypothetical protein
MTPEAKPEFVPILRELAAGLCEGDGGAHLITFKTDPAPYSSGFIPYRGTAARPRETRGVARPAWPKRIADGRPLVDPSARAVKQGS